LGQSSKELIRGLFEGRDLSRIPFIPWVSSFAAKLEQVPIKTMLSDAGILSRALINSQKLFGYDAIINVFDTSIEAEACGCKIYWPGSNTLPEVAGHPLSEGISIYDLDTSGVEKKGRLPVVIDATKRLNIIKGKEVAIAGMVTGPLTLAGHLKGNALLDDLNRGEEEALEIIETTGSIVLKLCRIYCEIGVDFIVIVEEMLGKIHSEIFQTIASPFQSIWNVVKFYNVHSLILSKGCSEEHIEPVLDLQADGVAISGNIDYANVKNAAQKRNRCFARSIPLSSLTDTISRVGESARDCLSEKEKGLFLSTEWEVPYVTNVNNMHEVMRVIRGVQGS
jgi:uroporphyrinogen decarboxylase